MALNSRYVSLKTVLDKVYRDNAYDTEISYGDAAEWAAEAMDLICVPMQYIDKVADIPIVDYRGNVPCDIHNLTSGAVIDKATKLALRGTSDLAYLQDRKNLQELAVLAGEAAADDIDPSTGTFQIDANGYPIIPDDIDYLRARQSNNYIYYKPATSDMETQQTYTLNNNYIFTSIKEGTVTMYYKAFPVDEKGMPYIPDNVKYIRAVAAYITWMLDKKAYRMNKIAKDIFEKSEQEWLWAVGSAKGHAHTPTMDQMESFKNMVVRLIPSMSDHASTYRYSGEQETITFRNSKT